MAAKRETALGVRALPQTFERTAYPLPALPVPDTGDAAADLRTFVAAAVEAGATRIARTVRMYRRRETSAVIADAFAGLSYVNRDRLLGLRPGAWLDRRTVAWALGRSSYETGYAFDNAWARMRNLRVGDLVGYHGGGTLRRSELNEIATGSVVAHNGGLQIRGGFGRGRVLYRVEDVVSVRRFLDKNEPERPTAWARLIGDDEP